MKSLIASLVLATLPPPPVTTAMRPTMGQFDLPGLQIIKPTLEHYLSPEKMTFYAFLGYMYKNCKNILNAFPGDTDPTNLKYDDWTKAAALVKLTSLKIPRK